MDLKPAEFLQQEEKLWSLRQVDRMQTPPSSSSSSSGVMTPCIDEVSELLTAAAKTLNYET